MNPSLKAALWMIGAIVSFSSMAIAGRAISDSLDTFEIMMYRSFVGLIIVVIIAGYAGTLSQITRDRLGLHFMRNLAHFTGQNLWFVALPLIPLAQVFALEFTTPIWVLALSPLLLGERLTTVRVLSSLIGFVGILIVARPGAVGRDPARFCRLIPGRVSGSCYASIQTDLPLSRQLPQPTGSE